jgi:hypothetical protein
MGKVIFQDIESPDIHRGNRFEQSSNTIFGSFVRTEMPSNGSEHPIRRVLNQQERRLDTGSIIEQCNRSNVEEFVSRQLQPRGIPLVSSGVPRHDTIAERTSMVETAMERLRRQLRIHAESSSGAELWHRTRENVEPRDRLERIRTSSINQPTRISSTQGGSYSSTPLLLQSFQRWSSGRPPQRQSFVRHGLSMNDALDDDVNNINLTSLQEATNSINYQLQRLRAVLSSQLPDENES